jgi:hypothetical protein
MQQTDNPAKASHLLSELLEMQVLQDCLIRVRQVPIRPQFYKVTSDVCLRNNTEIKEGGKKFTSLECCKQ